MVPQELIEKVKEFAYSQTKKYEAPITLYLDLANEKGQELAKLLKADKDIVLAGTLLMDCMLGTALKEGRLPEHIEMSAQKAKELLDEFPKVDKKTKENILYCVRQHHGVDKFHSLEAEICCNADCYRFASVEGVIAGIRYTRDMPLDDLVNLFLKKADEKWNALSLDICKKELEPQYKLIKDFLTAYK